ncbi:hypothetical protein BRO54_3834 [Geobacillus proteiniphilus]|uniref:Uncharacterized protein n=1 Tax=Geobacillus proteiniphilus TaxID=860353 RepID=A0A1Q5SHV5_9BACL|nr:hypothetical protein BRO54_3834 [Geobacillus proteiniphilus]
MDVFCERRPRTFLFSLFVSGYEDQNFMMNHSKKLCLYYGQTNKIAL